jgi:hypothetical protein
VTPRWIKARPRLWSIAGDGPWQLVLAAEVEVPDDVRGSALTDLLFVWSIDDAIVTGPVIRLELDRPEVYPATLRVSSRDGTCSISVETLIEPRTGYVRASNHPFPRACCLYYTIEDTGRIRAAAEQHPVKVVAGPGLLGRPVMVEFNNQGGGGTFNPPTLILTQENRAATTIYTVDSQATEGRRAIVATNDGRLIDPEPYELEIPDSTPVLSRIKRADMHHAKQVRARGRGR